MQSLLHLSLTHCLAYSFNHSVTHLLTDSLIYPHTLRRSITYSLTSSPSKSRTHPPTRAHTWALVLLHPFTNWPTPRLLLIDPTTHPLSLAKWLIISLTHICTYSYIHTMSAEILICLTHSLSHIYSFIDLLQFSQMKVNFPFWVYKKKEIILFFRHLHAKFMSRNHSVMLEPVPSIKTLLLTNKLSQSYGRAKLVSTVKTSCPRWSLQCGCF